MKSGAARLVGHVRTGRWHVRIRRGIRDPAEVRLAALGDRQHEELRQVVHEDIAAELGTAREVVSRLLEMFERRDAIRLSRGRIEIRNDALLRELT